MAQESPNSLGFKLESGEDEKTDGGYEMWSHFKNPREAPMLEFKMDFLSAVKKVERALNIFFINRFCSTFIAELLCL